MDKDKPLRLLYKLVIALIYTDIELRNRQELARAAEQYCLLLDEVIDGDRFVQNCVNAGILILEREVIGVQWYKHNLTRTIH